MVDTLVQDQHLQLKTVLTDAYAGVTAPRHRTRVARPALEVADIFRRDCPVWWGRQHGHLNLVRLKVMSAIEQCRVVHESQAAASRSMDG
jgi:hypothetical protein